jgi:hypothetical protein
MAAALVLALVGYWVLLRWVPIPGVGVPGRDVPFLDVQQNLVSWIDRHLFPYHLYRDVPDHNMRDPEGLLSDLPAIGTALMGLFMFRSVTRITETAIALPTRQLLSGGTSPLPSDHDEQFQDSSTGLEPSTGRRQASRSCSNSRRPTARGVRSAARARTKTAACSTDSRVLASAGRASWRANGRLQPGQS